MNRVAVPNGQPWLADAVKRIEEGDYDRTNENFMRCPPQIIRNRNGRDHLVTIGNGAKRTNACVICFVQHGSFKAASENASLSCIRHRHVNLNDHTQEKKEQQQRPRENLSEEQKEKTFNEPQQQPKHDTSSDMKSASKDDEHVHRMKDMIMKVQHQIRLEINGYHLNVNKPRQNLVIWFILMDVLPGIAYHVSGTIILLSLDDVVMRIWDTDIRVSKCISTSMSRHLHFERLLSQSALDFVQAYFMIMYSNTPSGERLRTAFSEVVCSDQHPKRFLNEVIMGSRHLPMDVRSVILPGCVYGYGPTLIDLNSFHKDSIRLNFTDQLDKASRKIHRQEEKEKQQQKPATTTTATTATQQWIAHAICRSLP